MADASDAEVLGRIAASSYRFTRFYADGRLPDRRCDDLYRSWIEQDCRGRADAVLVAELGGEIAGYVSCGVDRDHQRGTIGLVGVSDAHRGRGVGSFVVEESLRWFRGEGATTGAWSRRVGTGQHCGCMDVTVPGPDTGFWFHKWYPAPTDP